MQGSMTHLPPNNRQETFHTAHQIQTTARCTADGSASIDVCARDLNQALHRESTRTRPPKSHPQVAIFSSSVQHRLMRQLGAFARHRGASRLALRARQQRFRGGNHPDAQANEAEADTRTHPPAIGTAKHDASEQREQADPDSVQQISELSKHLHESLRWQCRLKHASSLGRACAHVNTSHCSCGLDELASMQGLPPIFWRQITHTPHQHPQALRQIQPTISTGVRPAWCGRRASGPWAAGTSWSRPRRPSCAGSTRQTGAGA